MKSYLRDVLGILGKYPQVIFLVLSPLLLSMINSNWLYPQVGNLDTWYYLWYFYHWSDPDFLPRYYKISCLP